MKPESVVVLFLCGCLYGIDVEGKFNYGMTCPFHGSPWEEFVHYPSLILGCGGVS